jgi:hypothetical protein
MEDLLSENPLRCRLAADIARRVSSRQPGIFCGYIDVLIDLLACLPLEQWQSRGYVSLAAANSAVTVAQRRRLAALVRPMLEDKRTAVRANGLETFAILAQGEPELREEVLTLLEESRIAGTPSMRARARRMLKRLSSSR